MYLPLYRHKNLEYKNCTHDVVVPLVVSKQLTLVVKTMVLKLLLP